MGRLLSICGCPTIFYAACTQGSSSRASFGRGSSSSSQHAPAPDMADADLATPIVRRGAGSTATFFTKVCCASPGRLCSSCSSLAVLSCLQGPRNLCKIRLPTFTHWLHAVHQQCHCGSIESTYRLHTTCPSVGPWLQQPGP